jgi:hypothetical protein
MRQEGSQCRCRVAAIALGDTAEGFPFGGVGSADLQGFYPVGAVGLEPTLLLEDPDFKS